MHVGPYYSVIESCYHDNTKCGTGSTIPAHNRVAGTGNRPICKECVRLTSNEPPKPPIDEDKEDVADAAIARQRLTEIKNDPTTLITGDALKKILSELERR
jgi:hypothetical protein